MSNIHKTAIVDKSAIIDGSVQIAAYSIIGKNVSIGAGTKVGPHCIIENADIGKNNTFTASAYIGTPPQDFKMKDILTKVSIGDGNIIRECVSIHRSTDENNPTTLGNNCMLMAYSHLGHDCKVGNEVVMVNSVGLSGHVIIEDKVIISGLVGIHQFVRIGKMAMISGGAMVSLDIPPFCRAQGDRAKLSGLNSIGLRRNGLSIANISLLKKVYRLLFVSKLAQQEALDEAKKIANTENSKYLISFCENSKRGIASSRIKI